MAVSVPRRIAGNVIGYGAAPGASIYYFGWLREGMAEVLTNELDPVAAGALLGELGAFATGATLEHNHSRLRDSIQRGLGRMAGLVAGAAAGAIAGARNGENRYISGAITGGLSGYVAADITSRAAPYWGNMSEERAEEAAATRRA